MHQYSIKLFSLLNSLVFISYALFFGLFFLVFPLNDSLFGDFDTWCNIALFMEMKAYLTTNTDSMNTFFFPEEHSWINFGLSFYSGIIWVFFSYLGLDFIWAYWIYMILILSLNAISLFFLSGNFINSRFLRYFLGISVFVHPVFFLNFDNPNILIYFFSFFGLHFLIYFFKHHRYKYIVWFSILMALQMYAAPYVFAYSFFLSFIILLYYGKFYNLRTYKGIILSIISISLFISPFLFFYFLMSNGSTALQNLSVTELPYFYELFSLRIADFLRPLPSHILYGKASELYIPFVALKHIFPGVLLSFCLFLGLWFRKNYLFFIALLVFFILGSGHYLVYTDAIQIKSPFYFFYANLGFENILRIPSRFNILVLISIALIAFKTLAEISKKSSALLLSSYFIAVLIFVESALWKKKIYPSIDQLEYFNESNEFMLAQGPSNVVTLNLPTGIIYGESDKREFFYMINRTVQANRTVNGSGAYNPDSRIELWKFFNQEDIDADDFCNYIRKRLITAVLVFPELTSGKIENEQVNVVNKCSCLKLEREFNNGFIYSVIYL